MSHAWKLVDKDVEWETRNGKDVLQVYRCSLCGSHVFTSEIDGDSIDNGPWKRMEARSGGWTKAGDRSADGWVDMECRPVGTDR